MHQLKPPPTRTLRGGRALVLLASTAVFVAMLLGFVFTLGHTEHLPQDPGTPATVTTIGGPR